MDTHSAIVLVAALVGLVLTFRFLQSVILVFGIGDISMGVYIFLYHGFGLSTEVVIPFKGMGAGLIYFFGGIYFVWMANKKDIWTVVWKSKPE